MESRPGSAGTQLVVRPHPRNAVIWGGHTGTALTVWPQGGRWPDSPEARQDYFDSLYHAAAVIGVNTSAFLDAACVDRPCVTILSERYRKTQSEIGHFRHLTDARFIETAARPEDAAGLIEAILGDADERASERSEFVRSFIRPRGLDQPASRVAARAVRALARGWTARRTDLELEALAS
jgi:hypothetical protein